MADKVCHGLKKYFYIGIIFRCKNNKSWIARKVATSQKINSASKNLDRCVVESTDVEQPDLNPLL